MNHDFSLENIAYSIIILLGGIIVAYLKGIKRDAKSIKQDTTQVNNAVNHIQPGSPTLTLRVDRIEETLHTIQYDQDQAKQAAIQVKDVTSELGNEITQTKLMVENLMKSHVNISDKLENMLNVMPKRKEDQINSES